MNKIFVIGITILVQTFKRPRWEENWAKGLVVKGSIDTINLLEMIDNVDTKMNKIDDKVIIIPLLLSQIS